MFFRVFPRRLICGQQRLPVRLNYPVNDPIGMGLTQSRNRRQGMQNVAHGTEPDHKQAKVGVGLQALIFSRLS